MVEPGAPMLRSAHREGATMKTLALATILALGLLAVPLVDEAQQVARMYRLGVLGPVPGQSRPVPKALDEGLREVGYVDGRNLAIEWSLGSGLAERAAELVRLRSDVIVALSESAAFAAKQATNTIPIVMLIVGDPIAAGLVASLARPGGNITGLATEVTPELSAKQLQLLKEVVPTVQRVAVLLKPDWGPNAARWNRTQQAAQSLRVALARVEVRRADDLEAAFGTISRERADAVFVFGDPLLYVLQNQIGDLAARNRLPSMSQYREGADAGGLISYGPNLAASARRIAIYVDKILKGAKPADLPIEALGLTIPQSLLLRADQVIE
jgi:putative tryptophan/tyrosine transport system substrate-binding protein